MQPQAPRPVGVSATATSPEAVKSTEVVSVSSAAATWLTKGEPSAMVVRPSGEPSASRASSVTEATS